MKTAWTAALGLAFAVHAASLWMVWHGGHLSAPASQRPSPPSAALSVRLLSLTATPSLPDTPDPAVTRAATIAPQFPAPPDVSLKVKADRSVALPAEPAATRPAILPAQPAPHRLFLAGELDRSPRPLAEILPEYPEHAGARSGSVVLRLIVGEDGVVELAEVVSATTAGVFEESARAAFLAARFEPGLRGGLPVRSEMTIEVEFTAADRSGAGTARY